MLVFTSAVALAADIMSLDNEVDRGSAIIDGPSDAVLILAGTKFFAKPGLEGPDFH